MRIKVLLFGLLKDMAGSSELMMELEDGATPRLVFDRLAANFPALTAARGSVVVAVNQHFMEPGSPLADGDELAFLPPVSGGSSPWIQRIESSGGNLYALTRQPINAAAVARDLLQGCDGAFVNFEGVVRNNTKGRATRYLEYECYEAMAIRTMADIGEQIAGEHAISRLALLHRLGRMEIGETSVAVIAFSPHRKAAFAAALEGINRLKKLVPIWKKEFFEDGEVWVEGEWDERLKPV